MKRETNEIIINERFSSLCMSDVEMTDEGEEKSTPKIRQKMIYTSELITRLRTRMSGRKTDQILPPNCRYIYSAPGAYKVYVIEDPPSVRTIALDMSLEANIEKLKKTGKLEVYGYDQAMINQYTGGRRPHKITVAFPYLTYLVSVTERYEAYSLRVFYRVHPLTSPSDYLLIPNLPNIDSGYNVCLGEGSSYGNSPSEAIAAALNRFWRNSFNTDYIHAFKQYEEVLEVSDFLTWQYYSHKDPLFVFAVQWKTHSRTLKEEAIKLSHLKKPLVRPFDFTTLADLFTKPVPTSEKKVYLDPCEGIAVNDSLLSIGDEIKLDGKVYWVSGFKGMIGYPPQAVLFENENQEIVEKILSENFKSELSKQLVRVNEIESLELKNGITIKPGDIVEMMNPLKTYRKVMGIRLARDNNTEVKLGTDYYFADSLELKIFDQKLNLHGQDVEVGRRYTLANRLGDILLYHGRSATLTGMDVNKNGLLTLSFEDSETGFRINETYENLESRYRMLEEGDSIYNPVFRFGPKMFTTDAQYRILSGLGILYTGARMDNAFSFVYNPDVGRQHLLRNGEFNLPSYDINLNFKIGDLVIFADWEDTPEDMTNVREIIGISCDEKGEVKITARDRKDNIRTIIYANVENGNVNMGKVRKVSEEYNGLKAGMKIRARVTGISKFPKKDVNQIVAFVMDTGTGVPLVLCSNRCTIWAHENYLSQFSYLSPSSSLWERNEIAEPVRRVPMQGGDLVKVTRFSRTWVPSMMIKDRYEKWRRYPVDYMYKYLSTSSTYSDERIVNWGLLTPRFSQRQIGMFQGKYVYPNLHGGFVESEYGAGLRVNTDWRCACSTSS